MPNQSNTAVVENGKDPKELNDVAAQDSLPVGDIAMTGDLDSGGDTDSGTDSDITTGSGNDVGAGAGKAEVSDVLAYKTSRAKKLSVRSEGLLSYQLGYVASIDEVFIRLCSNDTGGYFSKEWIPIDVIKSCLIDYSASKQHFSAAILKTCFVSRSQNNAGFLAAILKAEGVLTTVTGKLNLLVFDLAYFEQWQGINLSAGKASKPDDAKEESNMDSMPKSDTEGALAKPSKAGSKNSRKSTRATTESKG